MGAGLGSAVGGVAEQVEVGLGLEAEAGAEESGLAEEAAGEEIGQGPEARAESAEAGFSHVAADSAE